MKKIVCFFVVLFGVVVGLTKFNQPILVELPQTQPSIQQPLIELFPILLPRIPQISVKIPEYLSYTRIIAQLDKWHEEAPDLTERGTYGESTRKQPLHYIRVTNLLDKSPKKVVLITAAIHGNEALSCSTLMAYIGNLLNDYSKEEVKELINNLEIYFIPVVSPDSYPNSRYVDGVDPNRNFPNQRNNNSVPPIKALCDFFNKIKPSAVMSCHTSGRVYLIPPGDTMTNDKNDAAYRLLVNEMSKLSGYRLMRACDMYGPNGLNNPRPQKEVMMPIWGTEIDYYNKNNAFAIVAELGTHQRLPTLQDTKTEFDKTYKAFLLFAKEAVLVQLK